MNICLLLVVLNTENDGVGKMQTPICQFYYLNIHLKCHKFA